MTDPIAVHVYSADPILQAGLISHLRDQREIRVVESVDVDQAIVAHVHELRVRRNPRCLRANQIKNSGRFGHFCECIDRSRSAQSSDRNPCFSAENSNRRLGFVRPIAQNHAVFTVEYVIVDKNRP